jgi:hypothetical protein
MHVYIYIYMCVHLFVGMYRISCTLNFQVFCCSSRGTNTRHKGGSGVTAA